MGQRPARGATRPKPGHSHGWRLDESKHIHANPLQYSPDLLPFYFPFSMKAKMLLRDSLPTSSTTVCAFENNFEEEEKRSQLLIFSFVLRSAGKRGKKEVRKSCPKVDRTGLKVPMPPLHCSTPKQRSPATFGLRTRILRERTARTNRGPGGHRPMTKGDRGHRSSIRRARLRWPAPPPKN